jgi:hypothetical protein
MGTETTLGGGRCQPRHQKAVPMSTDDQAIPELQGRGIPGTE